jgi:hypothetical protein
MKNWISLLAVAAFLVAFSACEDNDPPISTEALPACIDQKVEEYKANSACAMDSARVTRYNSQIGFVYLFSYDYCCCDYTSPILDSDCNEVCFLGGIGGNSTCTVNSVVLDLTNPLVIWKK